MNDGEDGVPAASRLPAAKAHADAFTDLFKGAYQVLVRDVICAGGNPHEAEDVVNTALEEVLRKWDKIENPRAYARKAAINHLIKNRQRGQQRIRARMIERGDYRLERYSDPRLTVWEKQQWVMQFLEPLPPAQREVLAYMIDEFTPKEIAQLLGKSEAAVRQTLCTARKTLISYLAQTPPATSHTPEIRKMARPDEHK